MSLFGSTARDATRPSPTVVVGVGRVGSVLGLALRRAGHDVYGWHPSHSQRRRGSVSAELPLRPAIPSASPRTMRRAGLVLISVPDDALADVVLDLVRRGFIRPGQRVAHTSGLHGTGVLEPAARAGGRAIAMHPAMTFTGAEVDLDRLAAARAVVTCRAEDRDVAHELVAALGATPMWLADDARPLYHAALAHGANHLVTLLNDVVDLLRAAGVTDPQGTVGPLVRAAMENALAQGDAALTGPVSRGDAGTVSRHLAEISGAAPEMVPTYAELARRTTGRATAAGRLDVADAVPVLDAIADVVSRPPADVRPRAELDSSERLREQQAAQTSAATR